MCPMCLCVEKKCVNEGRLKFVIVLLTEQAP
jgi:hypothetical protein